MGYLGTSLRKELQALVREMLGGEPSHVTVERGLC